MSNGLYQRVRPTNFAEIIGQPQAVKVLETKLKRKDVPHAIAFVGPSGCGKTTLARVLANELGCGPMDLVEVNCGNFNGVDLIRDIDRTVGYAPASGKCRIWILDEFQQMTGPAQNAFLKLLEDTPDHVYFMLASTAPGKIIRAIKTRCLPIKVQALSPKLLCDLVSKTAKAEEFDLTPLALAHIAELAEGSARQALVLLESIIGIDGEEEQVEALHKMDTQRQTIDLCRMLLNPKSKWPDIAKLLQSIDEEPETMRRSAIGYAAKVLLSGSRLASRAYLIIQALRDNVYDSGLAGLVASCYEIYLEKG